MGNHPPERIGARSWELGQPGQLLKKSSVEAQQDEGDAREAFRVKVDDRSLTILCSAPPPRIRTDVRVGHSPGGTEHHGDDQD